MSFKDSITNASVRHFSGYICLKPQVGDDLSKVYSPSAISAVWKKWAMARMTQKKPCVGIIDSVENKFSEDPVVKVTGELNSCHHEAMNDAEVIETLKSLFCTLAKALKQTQTEFKFYGDNDKYLCRYNICHSKKSLRQSWGKLRASALLEDEEQDETITQHMQLPGMEPPKKEVSLNDLMTWYCPMGPTEVEC
ncbi:hypothetical protein SEMRO_199_G084440.1 [Seminavis robusta]|uniref:Uncharacterized protein n=1 Tax=Seminavis robusta TaxID=568900 RepID=A0A9N8HBX5_9STRA|nr:hypothetical protein SEMRO_199_G084440.1 [Seminavis robusta]|eukprot:Sro199_g084440.1 n/a (194) ;mRNA; f:62779-63360